MQHLYYHITARSAPLLKALLDRRIKQGKEDPVRYVEKMGIISAPRPDGALLWVHAASVGEAQSALILMDKCRAHYPHLRILLTTGTIGSAQLMEKKLPENAIHQFFPLDHPQWVKSFLDHWRPDFVLWIESEIWPNILQEVKSRKIPAFLINARLSKKSLRSWSYVKPFARSILSAFEKILCQTPQDLSHYQALGLTNCHLSENIKYSAKPLGFDKRDFETLSKAVYSRPVWLMASTHAGEEEIACHVHEILKIRFPDILTILIPRHPQRREEILKTCAAYTLGMTLRTEEKKLPHAQTDIYIADTFGELGLFYRLVPLAFIGRSLSDDGGGGHNPIEAAQLGCGILHGANIQNLQEIYDEMDAAGAAIRIADEGALAGAVSYLMDDYPQLQALQSRALKFSTDKSHAIDRVMKEILPVLSQTLLRSAINPTSGIKDMDHATENA